MLVNRTVFFGVLCLIVFACLAAGKIYWLLNSRKVKAVFVMEERGNALEQIRITHSNLYFTLGKDTIRFDGPLNLHLNTGDTIAARYNINNPSDARVLTFFGMWGSTIAYGGLPLFVLLICALHPQIVPYRSKLRLSVRKPFIQII